MRKIALLIALTIFGLTQANAQNFGFKGGYNYSSFNGDVAKDNTLKGLSGFYVGALLELPLGDVLSLQPEVIYAQSISQKLEKDAYAAFDFGVGAGLGVNLSQHFFVEARYTHSLTNALDPNNNSLKNAHISDDNNFKNAVLSLGLGVKF